MAILDTSVKALSNRLPKVISPKTHAIIDYASIGAFGLMAGLLWNRHKRAAVSSMICGAAQLGTVLLTDFPGGVAHVISFETHGKIDAAMAGAVATLPTVLGFGDDRESWFFRAQGMSMAAETGMTDFEYYEETETERRRRRNRRAA